MSARRRTRTRVLAAATTITIAGASLVGCGSPEDEAGETLAAFLAGWPERAWDGVEFVTPAGEPLPSEQVGIALTTAAGDLAELTPELTAGEVAVADGVATAEVTVSWPLAGDEPWSYGAPVRLVEGDDGWQFVWEPAVVHPELAGEESLTVRRTRAARGEILDGSGEPLMTSRTVVELGIWPVQAEDLDAELEALADALESVDVDLDVAALADRVAEADPDHFVSVITLRRPDFDRISDRTGQLPGVMTREEERHLAPSRTFARALLGTVDPVTAEDLENHPGVFEVGDHTGHGGLSGQYDEHLRGVPGQLVVIDRGADEVELLRTDPVPGSDLATTLDQETQAAAEEALAEASEPAALVAIRISDGAVLAVANTVGAEANPVNTALTAQVPPGSTFKLVTAYGLLAAGEIELDQDVSCPEEFTVEGRTFTNAGGFALGDISFETAVARSCNTAFAALAPSLGDDGLAEAGAALGIGGDWELGTEVFTGEVSRGGSATERAAAAFGQGTTVVSPAAMAAATAAVARGAWLPPSLVVDPEAADPEPVALDGDAVADLQAALRAVVTDGTGDALADTPGGSVAGKTGTAEYADGSEDAHGWFVGWQDDLAFAVLVEDGGSGSGAAVPLVDTFLRAVN